MSSWFDKIAAATLPHKLQGWLVGSSSRFVNVLVIGKTGVGKSSLINGVVGKEVAQEGGTLDPCTQTVKCYSFQYRGVSITIWDAPGLLNGLDKDDEYVRDILNRGSHKSDLFWYCARLDDTRFRREDYDAIRRLTIGLGKDIWKHAVFVMTFANRVMAPPVLKVQKLTPDERKKRNLDYFKSRLMQWHAKLSQAVVEAGVDSKVVAGIPIVPVGYDKEYPLPDRDEWLCPFWYASILRMKRGRDSRTLKAKLHQIKLPKQITPDDFIMPQRFHEEPIMVNLPSGTYLPILIAYS